MRRVVRSALLVFAALVLGAAIAWGESVDDSVAIPDDTGPCGLGWEPERTTRGVGAGINLSWDDCGTSGALQRGFACTSNAGTSTLYGSAVTGIDMPQLVGQVSVLDLQINAATLSPWWLMANTQCRAGAMVASFNFLENTACLDPWSGNAAGGISYTSQYNGLNRARIRTVCAIPASTAINGTDEYYFFKVTMTQVKTIGEGSCAGCADQACIVFNSIQVVQPAGVGDYTIANPFTRSYVVWLGGTTPTRRSTWGSVKSLYR